jgi:hypothetical protein
MAFQIIEKEWHIIYDFMSGGKRQEAYYGKIEHIEADNYTVTFGDDNIKIPACGLDHAKQIAKEQLKNHEPQL